MIGILFKLENRRNETRRQKPKTNSSIIQGERIIRLTTFKFPLSSENMVLGWDWGGVELELESEGEVVTDTEEAPRVTGVPIGTICIWEFFSSDMMIMNNYDNY